MSRSVVEKSLDACPVCGSSDRESILDLPRFPLTGIYVKDPAITYPAPDQKLILCRSCGHGYLQNVVDPVLLYEETYTHRTGGSSIARAGNDFLWSFIQKIVGKRRLGCVLEIGCNDFYLLERLASISDYAVGLDPIWRGQKPVVEWPNVKVLGKSIGELDCGADIGRKLDLVVSAHTFEHVADPYDQLRPVVEAAAEGALFFIEVPSFDTQLSNFRFDQVFHQHIQYFGLASASRLIERLGCRYVSHAINYRYWGGTMLFAFVKERAPAQAAISRKPEPEDAIERIGIFRDRYAVLRRELEEFDGNLYAFGAAQMLPTVAYHLRVDMNLFTAILDDNVDRIGMFYPGWKTPIQSPKEPEDIPDSGVMIAALDSYRPIMRRVLDLNPRAIFYPLCKM